MTENVDIIGHLTGNWGRWQLRSVLLIYLSKIPAAWFMACIIFTAKYAKDGEYHCKPLLDNINIKNHTEWIVMSHPILNDGRTLFENTNNRKKFDYCNIYSDQEKTIDNYYRYKNNETSGFNVTNVIQPNKMPCQEFVHHSEYKHTSMVPEFDLVCSRKILIAVSQFWHLFGVLLGGIIATKLLEYISPRYVMFYGMTSQIIIGCSTGLVSNFNVHMFLRCVAAICCALMYTAGQVIFTDITGGRYRTTAICLFDNFWSIGVIMLPGVSYLFPNWTNMYLAISLPTCAYIILWFWIPNSPRWLLRKGFIEDTRKVLIQSIKTNDREHLLPVDLNERLNIQSTILINEPKPLGWLSLWDTPKSIIYMVALHTAWAIYVTNFNGMLLNIRAFGRDYLTVNTIVTGIFEILGVTIGLIIIFKTTRKWMWAGIFSMFAGFITCAGLLIPENTAYLTGNVFYMIPAMICKTAVSCSQAILVTCSGELVAPEKRKICLYSCIVWARIWLLTAPFIGVLSQIQQVLGLVAFGILTTFGGLATCVLISPKTVPSNKTQPLNLPSPKEGVWLIEKN